MHYRRERGFGRIAPRRGGSRRRPMVERLEGRQLLAVTLTSPGPVTSLTLGDDGSFQVTHSAFQRGQVYGQGALGDAGTFVRLADGTVSGIDILRQGSLAAATRSRPFHLVSQSLSANGQSAETVLDNSGDGNLLGASYQLTQVATLTPGSDVFRVDSTIRNVGAAPLTIDVFAAADIFTADNDLGAGYYDPVTGAVGGVDRMNQHTMFVRPVGGDGLQPASAYQEGAFDAIWSVIGLSGGHFSNSVLPPTKQAPLDLNADPNFIDNGAGLEWRAITIAPGSVIQFAHEWGFGGVTAPLGAQGSVITAAAGRPFSGVVATLAGGDQNASASDFSATIDWGDASSSPAETIALRAGGNARSFDIAGSHTYGQPGDYAITVTVLGPAGTSATAHGTARVAALPVVSGRLSPISDSGVSNSDGVTNVTQPTFAGTATPGATVRVFATPASGSATPIPIGQAVAASDGSWSATSSITLADGSYAISAQAQSDAGTSDQTPLGPATITVDTVGPRVVGVTVRPRLGQAQVTIQDDRGLLDPASLAAISFRLARAPTAARASARAARMVRARGLNMSTGEIQVVSVPATGRSRLENGKRYMITVRSGVAGVRDLAGNALDGEYRGALASGDAVAGGDFAASFDVRKRRIGPLLSMIPVANLLQKSNLQRSRTHHHRGH